MGIKEPLAVPLFDSPFFENLMDKLNYSDSQKELVRRFRENGILIIEDILADDILIEEIKRDTERFIPNRKTRIQDAWKNSEAIKELACKEKVIDVLRILYGREPIPFQTLNFIYGTQQRLHSDTVHFNSIPKGFICGVWIALEDVNNENGALEYVVGSHKIPEYDFQDLNLGIAKRSNDFDVEKFEEISFNAYKEYEMKILDIVNSLNLKTEKILIKKGQAIVWAANILHGGSKILNDSLTRYSQVTHYFFENCFYFAPRHSFPKFGQYYLRNVKDIRTNNDIPHTFGGFPVKLIPTKFINLYNVDFGDNYGFTSEKNGVIKGEESKDKREISKKSLFNKFKIKLIDD
ncbi:MAG: phytanoyl-CoA dioxygenase family protein [Candidatus Pacearchaeota archaeon]